MAPNVDPRLCTIRRHKKIKRNYMSSICGSLSLSQVLWIENADVQIILFPNLRHPSKRTLTVPSRRRPPLHLLKFIEYSSCSIYRKIYKNKLKELHVCFQIEEVFIRHIR